MPKCSLESVWPPTLPLKYCSTHCVGNPWIKSSRESTRRRKGSRASCAPCRGRICEGEELSGQITHLRGCSSPWPPSKPQGMAQRRKLSRAWLGWASNPTHTHSPLALSYCFRDMNFLPPASAFPPWAVSAQGCARFPSCLLPVLLKPVTN